MDVAKMYSFASLCNCLNAVSVMAKHYQVPVTTMKERIRECRKLGLLTNPGKGIRSQTYATINSKEK
jgi:hypothetical protein